MRYHPPSLLGAVLFVASLCYALPAQATLRTVRICIEYEVQFDDAWVGDYWTTTGPYNARGPYVKVTETTSGDVVHDDYVASSGTYVGCTPQYSMSDSLAGGYTIKVWMKNKVAQDNLIEVWDQWSLPRSMTVFVVDTNFVPTAGSGSYDFLVRGSDYGTGWQDYINVAAAGSYAVERRNGDITGKTFRFYMTDNDAGSCSPGAGCTIPGDGSWVGAVADEKQKIVHEAGHNIAHYGNGSLIPVATYTLAAEPGSPCPGGDGWAIVSKEYRTAAALEGFVHYYAITVWNDGGETDCEFNDQGWTIASADDCEGTAQHMVDVCGGTLDSRGVAVDWLTFWWDIQTNCTTGFADILEVWDGAGPHSWVSSNVASRLRDSALDQSLVSSSCWDGVASTNGTDP